MTAPDTPIFVISVAAEMTGMHPQTLRQYDRIGLVAAHRTSGGGRRYSVRDIELLRDIQRLSQECGLNLAGVRLVIEMQRRIYELQQEVEQLSAELQQTRANATAREAALHASYRRDLVPVGPRMPVLWRQPGRDTARRNWD